MDPKARDFSNVEDLCQDKVVQFQHKYFVRIAILVGFILPMLLGALWGNALEALIVAGAVRITMNQHFTFFINSVCHIFGRTTYSDHSSAKDNWFTALFTYGEGYHNFHHKFPVDYRNGIRFYDYDPSKWLIAALRGLGLASDLKRVSEHRIIECKIAMDEKSLKEKTQNKAQTISDAISPMLGQAKQSIMQALQKLESLEKTYRDIKKNRALNINLDDYRQYVKSYRQKLRAVRKELRDSIKIWTLIVEQAKRKLQPA